MGIVIRQGLKAAVVNYVGIALGAFNLLYLFPKLLTAQEIGLTRVLIDVALMLAGVAQIGTSGIVDRFFPVYRDDSRKHQGFLFLILIYPLVGFAVVVSGYLLFKNVWLNLFVARSPLLIGYYYYLIPFTFFCIYLFVLEAYCRAHLRIVVPMIFRELFLRIVFALAVILYYFKIITLPLLMIILVASYGMMAVGLLLYIKQLKKFYITHFSFKDNRATLKKILYFSLVSISSGSLGLIAAKIDVIFLSSKIGLKATGIYSIAFYIGSVIEIPRRAISQITVPLIAGFWQNNDLKELDALYKKVATNQFIAGLLIFLIVWCNIDDLLSIIPNSENYKSGKYVVLYIGLARLVDMLTGINTEIINTSPYFSINFWITFFSATLIIILNQVLIPLLGIEGAAVATLMSYSLFNFVKIGYLYKKARVQPFTHQTLLLLSLGLVIYLIEIGMNRYLLPSVPYLIRIAINSFAVALLLLLPVYYLKVSPDLNSIINRRLNGHLS